MRKSHPFLVAKLVSFLLLAASVGTYAGLSGTQKNDDFSSSEIVPHGCSVITMAKGGKVLFGGNDDYINLDSYYWVDPGNGQYYGVIWIGYPDNVQQGVNEHGLAYDANGLPRTDVNPHLERTAVSGDYTIYPIRIMRECKSVREVIEWVNTHQWHSFMHDQMHFADAGGEAVIISAGKDGDIAFTRKEMGDGFLVSTNFNVANPANGFGYPCWRYDLANEMLENILAAPEKLNLQDMVSVMDAIHQEGVNSWTMETMIADLKEKKVYLYYFYQFDEPLIINIKDELANPREAGKLSRLFPDEVATEANRRYEELQSRDRRCSMTGMTWIALVVISLVLLFIFPPPGYKEMADWVFLTIILGPFSILVLIAAGRSLNPKKWQLALLETIGDLVALVLTFLIFILALTIGFKFQMPWTMQLVFVLGGPVLFGWIIIPAVFISHRGTGNLFMFIKKRLPHAIISINLGLAGIFPISMVLLPRSIQVCKIMPFSAWAFGTLWLIFVLGAVLSGIVFLFTYEYSNVKAGYLSWSEVEENKNQIVQRPWSKSWLWIIVSFAILIIGISAGILCQ